MYCICSNMSFNDIVLAQKKNPLPFDLAVDQYTGCNSGCGSCISELYVCFEREGLLLPDPVIA